MSRFSVFYRIFASSLDEAEERAAGIALEQTVEIPRDVVPKGYIEDVILGKVESVREEGGRFLPCPSQLQPGQHRQRAAAAP